MPISEILPSGYVCNGLQVQYLGKKYKNTLQLPCAAVLFLPI